MSCPYFKEGNVGVCVAFELMYIPGLARMERYCFDEDFRICPALTSYMPEAGRGRDSQGLAGKSQGR